MLGVGFARPIFGGVSWTLRGREGGERDVWRRGLQDRAEEWKGTDHTQHDT